LLTEIRETAYESGYGAGRDEGAAAGREAAHREAAERFAEAQAHLVADLIRVVDEVDGMKRDLRIAAEKDLLEFALRLAEKLTLAIGRVNRESAVVNLGRALELIHGKGRLVVRAHPDDAATLAAFAESVRTRLHESSEIRLVSDESIAPGGCVVRAETTEVDARLETQLAELVSLLLAERSGHD
jgi:flagellar assembly protein FliH